METRTWRLLPPSSTPHRGAADRFAHSAGPGCWFVIRSLEEVEKKTIWIVKVGDFATIGTNRCKQMHGKGFQNH